MYFLKFVFLPDKICILLCVGRQVATHPSLQLPFMEKKPIELKKEKKKKQPATTKNFDRVLHLSQWNSSTDLSAYNKISPTEREACTGINTCIEPCALNSRRQSCRTVAHLNRNIALCWDHRRRGGWKTDNLKLATDIKAAVQLIVSAGTSGGGELSTHWKGKVLWLAVWLAAINRVPARRGDGHQEVGGAKE